MNRNQYMQAMGSAMALAETARQIRAMKETVDFTLDTLKRFWLLPPLLAAGWMFMVSDDERRAILEGVADQVLKVIPLDPLPA